jgi:esterase/lipase
LEKLKSYFTLITAAAAAIGVLSSGLFFVDGRYAKHKQFVALKINVEINDARDVLKEALENLYFYRKQNKEHPDDEEIQKRLKEAEDEVKELKEHLKELKKKQKNNKGS